MSGVELGRHYRPEQTENGFLKTHRRRDILYSFQIMVVGQNQISVISGFVMYVEKLTTKGIRSKALATAAESRVV